LRLGTLAIIKLLSTSLALHFKLLLFASADVWNAPQSIMDKCRQRARSDQDNQLFCHTERNRRQQK